jgi:hypothetical protein
LRIVEGESYLDCADLCEILNISRDRLRRLMYRSKICIFKHECQIPVPDLRVRHNAPLWRSSRVKELRDWHERFNIEAHSHYDNGLPCTLKMPRRGQKEK